MILLSLGAVTLSHLISTTDPARLRPDVSVSRPRLTPPDVLWRPYDTAPDDDGAASES